jgi:hypothetical protein
MRPASLIRFASTDNLLLSFQYQTIYSPLVFIDTIAYGDLREHLGWLERKRADDILLSLGSYKPSRCAPMVSQKVWVSGAACGWDCGSYRHLAGDLHRSSGYKGIGQGP